MIDIVEDRLKVLKKQGFDPKCILDIGAFEGVWSQMVHEIWPKAKLFLIEPNDDCMAILQLKNIGDTEITLLGRNQGEDVIYYASKKDITSGNSIFKENTWYFEDCEERKMITETLSSFCLRKNIDKVDLIKIDTQGAELEIILGGEDIIRKAEFILLETQNLEYNAGAPKTLDVMRKMDELGFMLFDITEIHHLLSGEMMQVDMLFARNDSRFIKRGNLWNK